MYLACVLVHKHPMAEKRGQISSRLGKCPFEISGKKCVWKVEICCQSSLSIWNLDRPVILPQIPVAQFVIDIQLYCKEEEVPWGHPIILQVGILLYLNWLKMQILGVIVVIVLIEESVTTPRPVLNAPESW